MSGLVRSILGMGNPLLDVSAVIDPSFLSKYGVSLLGYTSLCGNEPCASVYEPSLSLRACSSKLMPRYWQRTNISPCTRCVSCLVCQMPVTGLTLTLLQLSKPYCRKWQACLMWNTFLVEPLKTQSVLLSGCCKFLEPHRTWDVLARMTLATRCGRQPLKTV